MKVGIFGRTGRLLDAARLALAEGHDLAFVWTCRTEDHYGVTEADFQQLAHDAGCPFFNTLKLSDHRDEVATLGADICLSINWINVVREDFRSLFPHGILNSHAGDLPRYRGNACANWAIINFEEQIGLTVHKMADELDGGDIVEKSYLPIDDTTYISDIYAWLDEETPRMLVRALKTLETHGATPQDPSVRPLRTFPRKPEDARIDWARPARDIHALIRASSHPFPGAYCYLNGEADKHLAIYRADIFLPDFDFSAVPGQVCLPEGGMPLIAATDGLLRLTEFSLNGQDTDTSAKLVLKSLRNRLA
ncbi:methionyl-tRNA formyltransferase [Pyruvatibacter mobilis]|uniref:methionyl-tRNA formyltransferase n=1 Tax=Pyruvatibacter mobilis TaxID=1712261 RepID=UPI003BAAF427